MSEVADSGITVTEIAAMDQAIDVCPETVVAMVGRALRGPLNTAVLVRNFGEFRRRFGDLWNKSSLAPAARQLFEHGGKRLYVVRVASQARAALLVLPANGSALVLRAVDPGATERIRAAIDYDGLKADDVEYFNLTLQRVNAATGLVLDQELYRRVSWRAGVRPFIGDELLTSALARVESPTPTHRPECTLQPGGSWETAYVLPEQFGDDGVELCDYDLIGSHADRTGLFALEQVERFDLLYLPAPSNRTEVGPTAILTAERYCRQRGAILIVDPPAECETAADAARHVHDFGYASPHMLGYFPRVAKRGSATARQIPVGAAIAGLLCRQDRAVGPWEKLESSGAGLQWELLPACELDDDEEALLVRAGLNAIRQPSAGRARVAGSVTMGRASDADRRFVQLPVQRLCLQIINSLSAATRWAVFEVMNEDLAERVRDQVTAYFQRLFDLGALIDEQFVVQCDAGVSRRDDQAEHGITLQLTFLPKGCTAPVSMTLHRTPSGCRVGSTAFGVTPGLANG